MLRVSKLLFLCAVSARVGLAVRQNLKISQSGALATAMEQIGALFQANDNTGAHSKALDNIRTLAAITPGHELALNTALSEVIAQIKANVDQQIIDGFKSTQVAVVKAIGKLEDATSSALAKKKHADVSDSAWFHCIENEKRLSVAFEKAEADEKAAVAAILEPCAEKEKSKMFDSSPKAGAFSCDFSNGDSCNKELAGSYTDMMNELVNTLDTNVQEASQKWNAWNTKCYDAEEFAKDMKKAEDEAQKAWMDERDICQSLHEGRQVSLCSFGSALQTMCETVGAFSKLIEEVDAVNGGPNSEPDRQVEWKTTQITKCMLQKIIDGFDLDGDSLGACEDDVKYPTSVGQFNRMQTEFATQTSKTSFTCKDETITFNSGQTWNVPTGVVPTSSEYATEPFVPQVSLRVGTQPFAFCSPTASANRHATNPVAVAEPAPPLAVSYESRPGNKGLDACTIYKDALPDPPLLSSSHTIVLALEFDVEQANRRQWIFNIGQSGTGAEHWLDNDQLGVNHIQFGAWNGPQINRADIMAAKSTLASSYDGSTKTYKLFVDGELKATRADLPLDIKSGVMWVGQAPHDIPFQGCIRGVDVYRTLLTDEQIATASSKLAVEVGSSSEPKVGK